MLEQTEMKMLTFRHYNFNKLKMVDIFTLIADRLCVIRRAAVADKIESFCRRATALKYG